ncbi:MAG TPA: hypothetical protein VE777_07905 [Gaiellales bacterium]|jgi:hypothetical protein|nr:hypothetical protein [Gaiellales bacterium]
MRRLPAPPLAVAAWVAALAFDLVAGVIAVTALAADNAPAASDLLDAVAFAGVVMQGMATLGVLIARREPRNPIGWIFCAVPVLVALSVAAGGYGGWQGEQGQPLPGAAVGNWIAKWPWVCGLTSYALFVPLLFPDGRPPGPRWRLLLRADLAAVAWVTGLAAFSDSPPAAVVVSTGVVVAVLISAGLTSALVRYRRADATQRLQIRECVFAACASFVGFIAISILSPHEGLYALNYALLPLSVGLAMLRYRLYDVDVIIRRTLVYGCLVALLAAMYLAGVGLVGTLLRSLTGSSGTLAVTISTLAVVAAFQPLRSRIQRQVDRRFYRSSYDARAAVDTFSGRLRDEIDLDALSDELLAVVAGTVHPTHTSLWLRPVTIPERAAGRP